MTAGDQSQGSGDLAGCLLACIPFWWLSRTQRSQETIDWTVKRLQSWSLEAWRETLRLLLGTENALDMAVFWQLWS